MRHIAVIGSGPAGFYTAEAALKTFGGDVRVDLIDRLPVPYGLIRSGVAPDHQSIKAVTRRYEGTASGEQVRFFGNVTVGKDVTVAELRGFYDAVVTCTGAPADKRLGIPGDDLPGVIGSAAFVGWYNGHPDFAGLHPPLDSETVVVIGNGNVALDVARILTVDPDALAESEIAPAALDALRASRIEEVVVVGRRGPEHAAFTLPELVGLRATPGVTLGVAAEDLAGVPGDDPKLELLRTLAPPASAGRRITLRFRLAPQAIAGDDRAGAVELAVAGGPAGERIEAGLVITSIGYRGLPVAGLPYDADAGIVPNDEGRVVDPATAAVVPGSYVVGWIKRGPTGFIGTNRACSQDTIAALVDDYNAGLLPAPAAAPVATEPPPVARRGGLRDLTRRALAGSR